MSCDKKEYDLVFSLGGNCAAAHNLLYRGLRTVALPFDWTYINDESSLYKLADGFKNGFVDFMKYDNLEELSDEEEKTVNHSNTLHYADSYTGYRYVNHFYRDIRTTDEYKIVKEIFNRRTERLLTLMDKANKVLMVLNTEFYIKDKTIFDFYNSIKTLYPQKQIDFVVLNFGCASENFVEKDNICIYRYTRKQNNYDFTQTNYEWMFLDNIKLTKKMRNKISFKLFGHKIRITWSK